MAGDIIQVTDANFQAEVLEADDRHVDEVLDPASSAAVSSAAFR